MNSRKMQNLIVGTVVLVALFLLIFGMAFLNEYAPGKRMDEYVLMASEVGLLSKDDPVKFNGVKVGKVRTIELNGDNRVKIVIEVQQDARIPKGSRVQIQNVGLMGERMINVALTQDKEMLPPGSVLDAGYDYGIAETMGVAGQLVEEARKMLVQLQEVMDSTVGRPDFVTRVNAVVKRADDVSAQLEKAVADLDPKLRSTVGDLQAAGAGARGMVDRNAPVLDRVVGRADKATEDLPAIVADLKATSSDIRTILAKAKSGESTLGKLATDDAFYKELSSAVTRADSLLNRIQRKGLDVNVDLW